ncbi:hypothetical protein NFJ01_15905 [Lelliottia amnigena]|uniref:hypothetical protein n=1 Tax=Lelliottia amnigena TaxID=61646 RepID=UPI0020908AD8|nr:hypothetical protein [Lelliottia amnigena]USR59747.1 hypothetical protein NFJ01_15905 [Lelliottia amnigena]
MKDTCREMINDSMLALHALAKLMPLLTPQRSLTEMLETINRTLGSTLAWVSIGDESAQPRVVCAGEVVCHTGEVTNFLASTLLQQHHHSWRSIYWKESVGKVMFSPQHPGHAQLQSGVLYKFSSRDGGCCGYFFLAFSQRIDTLPILKNIVVVLAEKLKDYFVEMISRERMAIEMQRVVT